MDIEYLAKDLHMKPEALLKESIEVFLKHKQKMIESEAKKRSTCLLVSSLFRPSISSFQLMASAGSAIRDAASRRIIKREILRIVSMRMLLAQIYT